MHIGQVYFDKRYGNTQQGIPQGNAGMGISAGIDQDEIDLFIHCLMDTVYQCAFRIVLVAQQRVLLLAG